MIPLEADIKRWREERGEVTTTKDQEQPVDEEKDAGEIKKLLGD